MKFFAAHVHTHTKLDLIHNANKTVPRYQIFGHSIANLIFCEINIGTLGEGSSWHLWTEMSTGGLWFNQWLSRLPWNSRSSPVGGEIFERPQPSLDSGWWVVKQSVFLGKHPGESEPDFWGMFGLFLRSGALFNAQRPHWTTCPPTPPLPLQSTYTAHTVETALEQWGDCANKTHIQILQKSRCKAGPISNPWCLKT